MSRDARWFRLNVRWHESAWLAELDWPTRAVWPLILEFVKLHGKGGVCDAPVLSRFASGFDVPVCNVTSVTGAACSGDDPAMVIRDGKWIIVKWSIYQGAECAERVRKHRAKKDLNLSPTSPPDDVTLHGVTSRYGPLPCHATETMTETVLPKGNSAKSRAKLPGGRSHSEFLLFLLPAAYQTESLRVEVDGYFQVRTKRKFGQWQESTIRERALEYQQYPVESLVEAFRNSRLNEYRGVFPKLPIQNAQVRTNGKPDPNEFTPSVLEPAR